MTSKHSFLTVCFLLGLWAMGSVAAAAGVQETPIYPGRVIVVFYAQTLPSDAAARVQNAGGVVVQRWDQIGALVAQPARVDGGTLLKSLRRDPAVFAADYDRVLDLISPAQIVADEDDASLETNFPHPLPTFSPTLPADFFYTSTPQQWSVKRVGAQGGGIPGGGAGAWDITKGVGAKIAILDTGINPAHPDVGSKLVFSTTFTFDIPTVFGTPNCELPDASNPPFDLPLDQNGHGTWTSSLAGAAAGPGTGLLIGVAPDAQLLNIKVLRNRPATAAELTAIGLPNTPFNRCRFRGGSGLFSWVLGGILLANQQGADVISLSLGGFVPRNAAGGAGAALWEAFNRVTNFVTSNGSLIVAAAGNSALNLDNLFSFVHLPSGSPNVIAVTATTNPALFPPTPPARQPCVAGADCLAFYSNFGSSLHGLAAPGGDLPAGGCGFSGTPCFATGFVRGACSAGAPGTSPPVSAGYPAVGPPPPGRSWGCFSFAGASQHAWYVQAVGTSASTPHVAGVAALVKSANPSLTPAQIRTILQQTAADIGRVGYDQFFNFGLVDAAAAVQ